ncbi:hypothetical protein HK098_008098 [Nowakowskiella sp. JEL0407]|nr:hypothetical protein HK098_008098 [Nowakowskiella sp. JEL0407]
MILFSTSSSMDQIFEKLKQFIGEVEAWDKNDKDRVIGVLDELRGQMRKQKGVSVQVPSGLNDAIDAILIHLSEKNVFPLIDILRILILEESVQKQFADTIFPKIMMVLHKFGGGAESIDEVPKPTALMTLRLASNILASQHLANIVLSETLTLSIPTPTDAQMRIAIPYRAVSTALVVESLLSSELNIRQTAASFALNMAIFDAFQRSSDDGGDGEGEDEWVEWRCEVVAALIKALQDETGEEIELRLMASISILLRYSSSSVVQLAKVLELSDILEKKKGGVESATDTAKNSKIDKLAKEMIDLLNWEI